MADQPIEPPYGVICDGLREGDVVPFLGAGASLCGREEGRSWHAPGEGDFLPSGCELSRWLAEYSSFPSDEEADRANLLKVASYFVASSGRPRLRSTLHRVFSSTSSPQASPCYHPGKIHRFLAEIEKPLLIVTTNYDDLMEQAFTERAKPFHVVVQCTDVKEYANSVLWWRPGASEPEPHPPNKLPLSLDGEAIIYKMHGSVQADEKWDNFVITEEDYVEFLSRMTTRVAIPATLLLELSVRPFLFLGYSLADWNLRVLLSNLGTTRIGSLPAENGRTGDDREEPGPQAATDDSPSWAIQYRPSPLEKELWTRRNVNVYDEDLDLFVEGLARFL